MSETTTDLFLQINSPFGKLGEHYLSEQQTNSKMETSFQYGSQIQTMLGLIFQCLKASWRFVHCGVPSILDNSGVQKTLSDYLLNG